MLVSLCMSQCSCSFHALFRLLVWHSKCASICAVYTVYFAFRLLAYVSLWACICFSFLILAISPVEILMEHNNDSEIKKTYKINRKKCIICFEHVACYQRMRIKLNAQKRWKMRKCIQRARIQSGFIYLLIRVWNCFVIPISRFNAGRDSGSDSRNEPGSEEKSAMPIFVWQMVLSAFHLFNCETNIPRVSLFRNIYEQTNWTRHFVWIKF